MTCYEEKFEADPSLDTCHMQLFNATSMPGQVTSKLVQEWYTCVNAVLMLIWFSCINSQYSREPFCTSNNCSRRLAQTYHCCAETDGLPWLFLGVPSAVVVQSGKCKVDKTLTSFISVSFYVH